MVYLLTDPVKHSNLCVRLLSSLGLLFLCSFLDRTNVGYARILGMEDDLHLTNIQYEQGLAVFYATYIASELPSNIILKKITPRIWLPALTFAWGLMCMALGFVKNYAGFVAVRALLGLAEGGLFPGCILYLSSMYRREDLAFRVGLFFSGAGLAGAFGGLLARGLSSIGDQRGLEKWRWILIIEGAMTMVIAILVYWALPKSLSTARFFTPQQRAWAIKRLQAPALGKDQVDAFHPRNEQEEEFSWSEVRRGLFNISTWLSALAYFGLLAGIYSLSIFLPTIINSMHIAKSANEVQLYAVIPYAVATPLTLGVTFLSDRLNLRGTLALFTLIPAIFGYALITHLRSSTAQFIMTILMTLGMHATAPCLVVWNTNNCSGHYKRATATAVQVGVANCGGFVAMFIYPKIDGPRYVSGHTVVLGLIVFSWAL
jgi:MFS family permease